MNKYLSDLDLNRFGVTTVKADGLESPEDVDDCISFSKKSNAALLIARLDASRLRVAQRMEAMGGILCDTLVYYELRCRPAKDSIVALHADVETFQLREMTTKDQTDVINVAREAFSGYFGHYHSDPALDKRDCDE